MSMANEEVAAAGKPATYADYCHLPEGAPYQLIGGELVLTPSPSTYHQIISIRLAVKMAIFVQEKDLGLVLASSKWTRCLSGQPARKGNGSPNQIYTLPASFRAESSLLILPA